jgi:AhpD family alkylhydroperoxidase
MCKMARIEPLKGRNAPLLVKALNFMSRRTMGKEMEQLGILARAPRFLLPVAMMSQLVSGKSQVDPRVRSLATELAAHLNGCNWCMDFGRMNALRQGVPAAKLDALEEHATSPLFSPAERAALGLAEAMTRDVHVGDDVWAEARRHFSDRELIELVIAVATETFYNRVNVALGIESQGFCELPSIAGTARQPQPV